MSVKGVVVIKRRSIGKQLLFVIVGIAIGPLVLIGFILFWYDCKNQKQFVLKTEQERVTRLVNDIRIFIESLERDLYLTNTMLDILQKQKNEQKAILDVLQRSQHAFDELIHIDSSGKEHITQHGIVLKDSMGKHFYNKDSLFIELKRTRNSFFGEIWINSEIGIPEMIIAVPLVAKQDTSFYGVLYAHVRLKKIWDLIADIELGAGEQVYIANTENRIIAHNNPSVALRETHFSIPHEPGVSKGIDGKDAFITFKKIEFGNSYLTVIAQKDRKEVLRSSVRKLQWVFIMVLIIFTIAMLFALSAIKKIVTPIQGLTSAVKAVQEGNFDKKTAIAQNDEIADLVNAFNQMTEHLAVRQESLQKEITQCKETQSEIRAMNQELEEALKERTRLLEETQKEMIDNAHKAGMADIATAVLHNVGNVLTSVLTSANCILSTTRSSDVKSLIRASSMLKENIDTVEDFILHNPKGIKLLRYIILISEKIDGEWQYLIEYANRLVDKTNIISEIIISQQSFATGGSHTEKTQLKNVIDDAVKILENSLHKRNISLKKEYNDIPEIFVQRTKLVHIIINLLKNAMEAMEETPLNERFITLTVFCENDTVVCKISDTGHGIKKENLDKIFSHGFTTKRNGHGFGLHSCASYMREMGGTMHVWSQGEGKGTTFIAEFPLNQTHA